MKTFYLYLLAKVKGDKLTWTQAKFEADRISVLGIIEEKLDTFFLCIVSLYNFLQNLFITKGMFNLDRLFQHVHSKMLASFVGRLVICFVRGSTDYSFLFKTKDLAKTS